MTKTVKKKLNNPRSGENSRLIRLVLHSESLPKIDVSDPKQVEERVMQYFDFCQQHNLFPGIAGLSNWLGVHRDTLNSWKRGEFRKDTHQKIIQRAYDLIEVVLTDMLMDDRIPSPTGIFLLKSMFGYRDRFDIGLEAAAKQSRDPLADLRTTDAELARKYLIDAIPDDDPEDGKEGDSIDFQMQRTGDGDQGEEGSCFD